MKPAKRRIVTTFDWGAVAHRADFEHCPACDEKFESARWDSAAVTLVTGVVAGKHGSVAIISECPKCFERSWVHHDLRMSFIRFSNWPKEWQESMERELASRERGSVIAWGLSICWQCRHLNKAIVTTHAWRDCKPCGSGPVRPRCQKFEQISAAAFTAAQNEMSDNED